MQKDLQPYLKFRKRIDRLLDTFDDQVAEIYELEREIESFMVYAKRCNLPQLELIEQTYYAILMSIMANIKANRSNYIALRARIDALNKYLKFACYS